MGDYPECDKLHAVSKDSQIIGEFLEWLGAERQIILAEYLGNPEYSGQHELFVAPTTIEKLLAEYYDIDLNKVETEKRKILEMQREINASMDLLEVLG